MKKDTIKLMIDIYLEKDGNQVPRDTFVNEYHLPEDEVIDVQRHFRKVPHYSDDGRYSEISLTRLGDCGCALIKGVTKKWAYEVLGIPYEAETTIKLSKKAHNITSEAEILA